MDETNTQKPRRQFCTFWLGDRFFGIDILDVKEINEEAVFTNVYHATSEIKGLVNIRGHIYLIIDLAKLLGLVLKETKKQFSLIIFKPAVAEELGILVEKIGGIVKVDEESIEPVTSAAEGSLLITGVCKLDNKLMDVIDPRCFMRVNLNELAESLKLK